eukprot:15365381-Ditylum_brightwellii.AAC.1
MLMSAHLGQEEKKLHSHLRKEYFLGLPGALQHLRQQKLCHSSLVQPHLSPWQKVDKTAGRQCLFDAKDYLGLVLAWTRTCGAMWVLGLIFGITSSPLDRYLKFGMQLLLHILKAEENIQPRLPSKEKFDSFVDAIAQKYPLLGDNKVYCAMDGLKLRLQMPDGKIISMVNNMPVNVLLIRHLHTSKMDASSSHPRQTGQTMIMSCCSIIKPQVSDRCRNGGCLASRNGEQQLMLHLIALLCNARSELVGIN